MRNMLYIFAKNYLSLQSHSSFVLSPTLILKGSVERGDPELFIGTLWAIVGPKMRSPDCPENQVQSWKNGGINHGYDIFLFCTKICQNAHKVVSNFNCSVVLFSPLC